MSKHRHHEKRPYYQRHPFAVAIAVFMLVALLGIVFTHAVLPEWGTTLGTLVGALIAFLDHAVRSE